MNHTFSSLYYTKTEKYIYNVFAMQFECEEAKEARKILYE